MKDGVVTEVNIDFENQNYKDIMIIDDKEISEKIKECIYEFMETINDEEKIFKITYTKLNLCRI